ncbi:Pre-mRNA splicing factor-domain-containing protein [Multifurca ochricompacta]|uniref:Pre-mRNA splicing factor-domain-containing protein n=1 Tax=Multifurca ochricompacta TaxID=376703 RepID=A0AAD4QU33_9AGAM|nr:Pre-mRNA splicing factor-domain-containing protein [Multifurca ochricompacta]
MGGGDLNMKKSWHPLLMKNQERVWLEEKKALEEKKKLEQLRKEKEEERQLQELQRLQEEQTGKKRTEKLEWMYATPATGSSQNPNDLEDYLLGKKRVDKILIGSENEKIGASHKNFIAIQNANTPRDIAAKVREDPLLAIKQQEAAAYEALMSNPLRLRELQERNGIKPSKKEKKEKKQEKKEKKKDQRRREKEERHRSRTPLSDYDERDYRHRSPRSRHSLSPRRHPRSCSPTDSRRFSVRDEYPNPSHSTRRTGSRSRSPDYRYKRRERSYGVDTGRSHAPDERRPRWPRSDESDAETYRNRRGRSRSRSPELRVRHDDDASRKRHRSYSPAVETAPYHKRTRPSSPPRPSITASATEDRAARLAAMTVSAVEMSTERKERLNALLEKEKAELEAEERGRAKSKGMGGFLSNEQKKVLGVTVASKIGLEEAGRAWYLRWTDSPPLPYLY